VDLAGINAGLVHHQRLESLGLLACGLAHELKNIVTPLILGAQLTALEIEPDHPAQKSLATILAAAKRARELVQRFSEYGSVRERNLQSVALDQVVTEVLALLRPALQTEADIRTRVAPDLPLVSADNIHVHQVVTNLVINAWQALASNRGLIEIALAPEAIAAEAHDQPMSPAPGQYVRLTVKDNGVGMDNATRGRIFEEFFTTKTARGTGLGLAIVRAIARECGGGLTVESIPGRGSTFNVYWPIARAVSGSRA
jgi:signal transduction histidine kinase